MEMTVKGGLWTGAKRTEKQRTSDAGAAECLSLKQWLIAVVAKSETRQTMSRWRRHRPKYKRRQKSID